MSAAGVNTFLLRTKCCFPNVPNLDFFLLQKDGETKASTLSAVHSEFNSDCLGTVDCPPVQLRLND